jgi:hypothetical protein
MEAWPRLRVSTGGDRVPKKNDAAARRSVIQADEKRIRCAPASPRAAVAAAKSALPNP